MLTSIAKLKKQKKSSVDEDIGQKESHILMKDNTCITTLENSFIDQSRAYAFPTECKHHRNYFR